MLSGVNTRMNTPNEHTYARHLFRDTTRSQRSTDMAEQFVIVNYNEIAAQIPAANYQPNHRQCLP